MRGAIATASTRLTTRPVRRVINDFVTRHELAWDVTMAILAILFIVAGALEDHPIGSLNEHTVLPLEMAITAVFALEFAVRFFAADSRARYIRSHWIDLLALLPAIRFLRLLRLGRVVYIFRAPRFLRLGIFVRFLAQANRTANQVSWIATRNGVHVALIASLGLVVIGGSAVWEMEHSINPLFTRFGDAIWWAFATLATVGYGNGPVTLSGRAVAVVLMVVGISCFGLITATVTTLFVHRANPSEDSAVEVLAALRDIQHRLERLESREAKRSY
jgi:voltage-gated potassium channel